MTGTIVVTGQVTFLLLLPLTIAWVCARRGAWTPAAILLGILASVKPFLGIFAVFFAVHRRGRPLLTMVLTVLGVFAGGWFAIGATPYVSWFRALGDVAWAWSPMNASLNGLFTRALGDSPFFTPVIAKPWWIPVAVLAGAMPLVISTVVVLVRDRSSLQVDRGFAGLYLTALLVSPLGWIYYGWLATGPAAGLVLARRHEAPVAARALVLLALPGLFCPVVLTLAVDASRWTGVTIGSVYSWSVLLLWAAWLIDARAARRDAGSTRLGR
jgi:hypothetical protein